jgi:hypothetical protein
MFNMHHMYSSSQIHQEKANGRAYGASSSELSMSSRSMLDVGEATSSSPDSTASASPDSSDLVVSSPKEVSGLAVDDVPERE